MKLSPLILFTYNRPKHTQNVLETLERNELASETDLFIYSDGSKTNAKEEQRHLINENRKVIHRQWKFKSITIVESQENKGLASSIIEGVTNVINKYGKAIILEDDLLTSPYFLKYMNSALDYYEKYPAVFSISANRPPLDRMHIPTDYQYDVFVSLRPFSTGWATWKDRWNSIDWSLDYLERLLSNRAETEAFNRAGDDMTDMLCLQRDKKIDSWAIRFAYAHFVNHAVAILPCNSYVDNIGFDNTGIHSGKEFNGEHRNDLSKAVANPQFVNVIYEDNRIINAFYNVYCKKKRPLWQKIIRTLLKKIGITKLPFEIKKKIYA